MSSAENSELPRPSDPLRNWNSEADSDKYASEESELFRGSSVRNSDGSERNCDRKISIKHKTNTFINTYLQIFPYFGDSRLISALKTLGINFEIVDLPTIKYNDRVW